LGSNDGELASSAHLRYRYFWDTWNIRAHTVELGYRTRFGDRWLVEPHYRHYKQSAASFYANDFTTQMLFMARDRELSDFSSNALGAKASYQLFSQRFNFSRVALNFDYETIRYTYNNFTDVRTGRLYAYNANVFQLFLRDGSRRGEVAMKIRSNTFSRAARRVLGALILASGLALAAEPQKTPPPASNPQVWIRESSRSSRRRWSSIAICSCSKRSCCFRRARRVAVFVSVDVGILFDLDSVQLKVDDSIVTNYLYTERETQALHRGGVQRLYVGNLKAGKHELVAVFTGRDPAGAITGRGTTLTFDKSTDPKYIELQIRDETRGQQPEFRVKEW